MGCYIAPFFMLYDCPYEYPSSPEFMELKQQKEHNVLIFWVFQSKVKQQLLLELSNRSAMGLKKYLKISPKIFGNLV
jgi:hypothetical protein